MKLGDVRRRLERDSEGVPRCDCGQPLKPGVVLFGEYLPVEDGAGRAVAGGRADLMLCIGSSLEVYPAAGLPETTLAAGGQIAILTQGPTPLDRRAAVRMGGDVVEELEALLAALGLPATTPAPRLPARTTPTPRLPRYWANSAARALSAASSRPSAYDSSSRSAAADRGRQRPQLLDALGEGGRGGVGRELGQRRIEGDAHLEGRLEVAALVEVQSGPQDELLAGQRALSPGEQRGQPGLGRPAGIREPTPAWTGIDQLARVRPLSAAAATSSPAP